MLQRRALLDAARIAGLPRAQLIHETSAAALHRALDLSLGGAGSPATNTSAEIQPNRTTVLFFNMGSRHVEACVVKYEGATYQSKDTVAMNVAGCGVSENLGGHQVTCPAQVFAPCLDVLQLLQGFVVAFDWLRLTS
ncbi:Luminal-binding protein 1 (BiP 1) (78 kDa glucose-regulated protein homolog) (GRP-78) [Durusdinium trenchii]|uniref:Luminal-binding protein 1 (BiP 1) (78 kDa glucose-regulated protein homolog) (GRP-78) n=1 Tax=Durusdinium trenchii TaxID=1381693 RepID=A0ABP0HQR5_9DINO